MREILFRGKRTNNGEWEFGDLLHDGFDYETAIWGKEYKLVTEVDPSTVGQYTGLTDKNGKRIFEGDIVSYKGRRYTVLYYAPFAMWMLDDRTRHCGTNGMYAQFRECEVIGNIHDNPELLGVVIAENATASKEG